MRNILVSGSSGIIGYGIVRSLRKSGMNLNLIGTTIYEDSVAQGFCDIFELAPKTSDPGYIAWLTQLIARHNIDLIIPGIEADMYTWMEHKAEIENSGVRIVLNNVGLIACCSDKWKFYEELKRINSRYAIETSLNTDFNALAVNFGLPFLLKPRSGHGSKGIVRVENFDMFMRHQKNIGEVLMVQPIVGNENEEFTTSAFCDGKGGYFAHMTLKRKLSSQGYTEKAEVVDLPGIIDLLDFLCNHFKPEGPTNFQMRKETGGLKLLEINPRISSSTSIRTAFGYNEAGMAVEYYLDNKKPEQPKIKRGWAVRYTDDFIFYQ